MKYLVVEGHDASAYSEMKSTHLLGMREIEAKDKPLINLGTGHTGIIQSLQLFQKP